MLLSLDELSFRQILHPQWFITGQFFKYVIYQKQPLPLGGQVLGVQSPSDRQIETDGILFLGMYRYNESEIE